MLGLRAKKEDIYRLVYGVFRNSFIAQFQHNTYQKNYYIKNMIDFQQQTCSSENLVFLGDSLIEYGEYAQHERILVLPNLVCKIK